MFSTYNNGTVTFDGYDGTFVDASNGTLLPVTRVLNFDYGDYIDLAVLPPVATAPGYKIEPAFNGEVIDGVVFDFGDSFNIQTGSDGEGGVFVQAPPVFDINCLAADTLIATPNGERPAGALRAGDAILCHAGGVPAARGIVACHAWHCARPAALPPAVAPIRIAAGAFAAATPKRDLLISPDHAIFAGAILVPARHLINGLSIVQDFSRAAIDYVHIEVDGHDVMAAEGLLVETRLPQLITRELITRAGGFGAWSPRPPPGRWSQVWEAVGCAPLVVAGPALDALRDRLSRRAARRHRCVRAARAARAA